MIQIGDTTQSQGQRISPASRSSVNAEAVIADSPTHSIERPTPFIVIAPRFFPILPAAALPYTYSGAAQIMTKRDIRH